MLQTSPARAGTALVDSPGARTTAARAARAALEASGLTTVDLALCFHHGRHDPDEVLAGLRDELGDARILGGTAMGIITNAGVSYEGHEVGVAVVGGLPPASTLLASASGLARSGGRDVGEALGRALAVQAAGSDLDVLLLYSSIRRGLTHPEGLALNFGTPLLSALQAALGPPARSLAGGGLIDSIQPTHSHVLTEDGADADAAVALGLRDPVRMDTVVLHGCRPAGSYHRITRTDGPVLLEIDGRPALDVVDELLAGALPREEYPFNVILGVNRGDRYGPFDEEAYQTRLCLAVDEDRRGLVMFEPDLEPGSVVQLMRVSTDLDYVQERVSGLLEGLADRTPLLAVYADCAGRCVMGSAMPDEEGHAVRAALGDIPLLGFYTGVEIGPVAGVPRPLDWTGVLCLLST